MPFVLPPPEPPTALRGGPTSESPTVQYASALFGIFAPSPLSVPLNPLFCILKVGITAPPLPCSSTCTYLRFSLLSLPAPGAGGAGHLHPPAHSTALLRVAPRASTGHPPTPTHACTSMRAAPRPVSVRKRGSCTGMDERVQERRAGTVSVMNL